ncbi:hypothetical protein SBA2_540003 [Acidobacteriia bacterium SbA2]|nr:hypothetical protein SBA2_540003 [Acidobacteriia bacterium SbA2]
MAAVSGQAQTARKQLGSLELPSLNPESAARPGVSGFLYSSFVFRGILACRGGDGGHPSPPARIRTGAD